MKYNFSEVQLNCKYIYKETHMYKNNIDNSNTLRTT